MCVLIGSVTLFLGLTWAILHSTELNVPYFLTGIMLMVGGGYLGSYLIVNGYYYQKTQTGSWKVLVSILVTTGAVAFHFR